jgi:hypothetical protein
MNLFRNQARRARVGLRRAVGLGPEQDVFERLEDPSTPGEGKVVAHYAGIAFGFVHVYADGRVIYAFADPTLAILERRLTPEGVVKVRDLLRG